MTALLTTSDTAHSNEGLLALGGQGKKKVKQIVFAINITVKSLFPVKSKLHNRKKEKKKKIPEDRHSSSLKTRGCYDPPPGIPSDVNPEKTQLPFPTSYFHKYHGEIFLSGQDTSLQCK